MTAVVLDASALLALLKDERGASEVAGVLGDAMIGAFNLAEVISHFIQLGAPIEEVRAMLDGLPMRIMPADEGLAWEAGALRAVTADAGLSLSDRFCVALARREGVPAYTADLAWNKVADIAQVEVVAIR